MKPLTDADDETFRGVKFVLTDMDDTLTHKGQLAAQTYDALERLRDAGRKVIVVTAAPAGWCDQMARMWPVDGVIGENGGFYFARNHAMNSLVRLFWHGENERPTISNLLAEIGRQVQQKVAFAEFAEDHRFRLTSLAFTRPANRIAAKELLTALVDAGAQATTNNLWVLGWLGGYDKLAMSRRVLWECFRLDIQKHPDAVSALAASLAGPAFAQTPLPPAPEPSAPAPQPGTSTPAPAPAPTDGTAKPDTDGTAKPEAGK